MGAVGQPDMRHAAAEDADHHRLHDGQSEEGGDRGIDGVATGRQHFRPGGGGQRMVGDDHASAAGGGVFFSHHKPFGWVGNSFAGVV